MADDEKLELLRSLLARAYEKRQPFPLRLIRAVKDWMGASTPKKPHDCEGRTQNPFVNAKRSGKFFVSPAAAFWRWRTQERSQPSARATPAHFDCNSF